MMKKYIYSLLCCIFFLGNACSTNAQIITTIAGNGTGTFSGDGGTAITAAIHNPTTVAVDASGKVYIADWGNNRVRMLDQNTGIIKTIAGGGVILGDGGQATAATLNQPNGIIVD